ncbi:GOLPH3/VPS74 family protein [Nonomuraea sp. SYSU D8015]|uniref:GOLPH3/VPS74 family protein n=1 Tax=Nonomuraea sp. SYSU D8015 TaxID=2593644 RepID=UPI001660AF00|nr:GPP34 family phosphoprotein [Nonomuraea sp. SYSU D8015]
MSKQQLTFADELTLLAHRENDGKQLIPNNVLNVGLIAAELAELASQMKAELVGPNLAVVDRQPIGDAELDAVLARMAKVGKALPPSRWLIMINPVRKRRRYLQRLSQRGAFEVGTSRILGVIPVARYRYANPAQVRQVRQRLGKVIRGQEPDARTVTLLALAHHSGVLAHLFAAGEDKRIEKIVHDDWAGQAIKAYMDKTTNKPGDSGDSVILLAAGGS